FLDLAYNANLTATPAANPVVLAGWTALRDLANGLFILLVLWVAITIIFNLETLGGKRLLVRIIVVALLINFSLLMATTVFAFANQLALPFARALSLDPFQKANTTLSTIIVNNTRIHTVGDTLKAGVAEELKKGLEAAGTLPPTQNPSTGSEGPASLWIASVPQSLGVPEPIPSAQAGDVEGLAAGGLCLAATAWFGAGAIACPFVAMAAGSFINIIGSGGGLLSTEMNALVNLGVADFFLAITAFGLFSAAVLLAVRYIAMIFLGVFAPIAFLGLVVPRYGERIWNMWLDNLFRWALVAPIFYFLLYLALYMLDITHGAQLKFTGPQEVALQGNALYIFSLMTFLVFLWASIFLTRKAAGM
ncbi:MAG: hypothetical protein AAB912_02990, partial [Patescibacteria group bacterium]